MATDSSLKNQSQADFYVWQIPGKPVSIHLSLEVVERLKRDYLRVSSEYPQRGLRGVLLGHSISKPEAVSFVEDYQLLPDGEDAMGRIYFSPAEEALAEAVAKWPREDWRHCYAIGFFRSERAGWLALNDRDLTTARKFFSAPDNVALLIHFDEHRGSEGAFFIWEDGHMRASRSYHEFPLDAAKLAAANLGRQDARREASKEPPASSPPPLPRSKPSIPWMRLLPIVALMTIGIVTVEIALDSRWGWRPAAENEAHEAPLALKVASGSQQLEVSWRHNSPAILAADKGVMTISDGGFTKVITLDAGQLRDGHVAYTPLTRDVNIRLEVSAPDGKSIGESVQVVGSGLVKAKDYDAAINALSRSRPKTGKRKTQSPPLSSPDR